MRVAVGALALFAPGLEGWEAGREVLAGRRPLLDAPFAPPPPPSLPPAERRRTTAAIRLAMAAADATLAAAGLEDASRLASVFASSNGDGALIDTILRALAAPARAVSPTQFHNSVHNSPPAYWSIGAGTTGASTSVGCWDDTFAVGLLHAAAKAGVRGEPVLFCAYDAPVPPPLSSVRPTSLPFATAMLVTPRPVRSSIAELEVGFAAGTCRAEEAAPLLGALLPLYRANPAARALRLLEALATGETATVRLGHLDDSHLEIGVRPC